MKRLSLVSLVSLGSLFVGVLALPRTATAGNGLHPRTPVDWTGAPCMTIVDRSQSTIFPLVYGIPYEDTDVTADEVANSRTHQFFAFCRDHQLEEILPGWVSEVDLADADAAGLGDASGVDTELDVLDNAPDWAGCFVRISGDDERRPITFAAAADPVPWDVSMLAPGAWSVEGYTYEPWSNAWWPHPGVFKIIDDPDPAATGPAAALTFAEQTVEFGSQATISGCVDAMAGTTMTASWALSGFGMQPQWQVFAADMPATTGAFEFAFDPPMETISNSVLIKLELSDPMGRTWTAHGTAYIGVTENFGSDDNCGGGFVSCETDDGADTGTESGGDATGGDSTSSDSDSVGAQDSSDSSSRCTIDSRQAAMGDSRQAAPGEAPWRGLLFGLTLLVLGRRRLSSRRAA